MFFHNINKYLPLKVQTEDCIYSTTFPQSNGFTKGQKSKSQKVHVLKTKTFDF